MCVCVHIHEYICVYVYINMPWIYRYIDTLIACFAERTASQGLGKSRNTTSMQGEEIRSKYNIYIYIYMNIMYFIYVCEGDYNVKVKLLSLISNYDVT